MSRTVSTIDYKALAERLSRLADERASLIVAPHIADLRTLVTLLNGMAEAKPVAYRVWYDGWQYSDEPVLLDDGTPIHEDELFTRPAPQPQPERHLEMTDREHSMKQPHKSFMGQFQAAR